MGTLTTPSLQLQGPSELGQGEVPLYQGYPEPT